MKFLVLALCVCAANASPVGYKPWQPVQPTQQVGQAFAQAAVSGPEIVYQAVEQPTVKAVPTPVYNAPVAVAKSAVYNTPVAVAKSAAYTAPVAVAKTAAYADKEANAAILRSDNDVAADGYNYVFETQNGIVAQSSGALKKVDDAEVLAVQGSYQYVAPDGTPVLFSYIADENGYQPKSDLLPVGPPVPEYILRSLEYIRAHPYTPEQ